MNNIDIYNKSVGVVILSAGLSTRMKTPKPFLPFDSENLFIDRIIKLYLEFGCQRLVITINTDHPGWKEITKKYAGYDSIIFVPNMNPGFGRFYSVKLGLKHIKDLESCFIHNCDNPFIESDILDGLYNDKTFNGYVVPNFEGKGGHPILIGRELIENITSTTRDQQNLKEFLRNYKRNNIKVFTDKVLTNINSREDYNRYFGNKYENQNERYIS